MSLVKFKRRRLPWNEGFSDFFNRNRFFGDDFFDFEDTLPALNIKEGDANFEVELAVPGFEKKDFEITMKEDFLEVSAEKTEEDLEEKDNYTRREFNYNSFARTMQLPNTVDEDQEVKATYKNGILKLILAKKESNGETSKKKIEVV